MIPIEKSYSLDPFVRKAREAWYIDILQTQKLKAVVEIEHGLNIQKGQ